jgi:hypothetical protein
MEESIESPHQEIDHDEAINNPQVLPLEEFLNITQSYLNLTLPHWLGINHSLPPALILQTYSNSLLSWIIDFSDTTIMTPTFQDLKAFKKVKWEKYFDHPSQLLSNQRVKEAI